MKLNNILTHCIFLVALFSCQDNPKLIQEFYNDGSLYREYYLNKEDKLDKQIKVYYKNGNLESIKLLKNGIFEGKYQIFHENGIIDQEGVFVNGLIHGLVIFHDTLGSVITKLNLKNGESVGERIDYEKGREKTARYYISDSLVCLIKYDTLGNVLSEYRRVLIFKEGQTVDNFRNVDTLNVDQKIKYNCYIPQYRFNHNLDSLRLLYDLTPTYTLQRFPVEWKDSIGVLEFDFYKMVDYDKGMLPEEFKLLVDQDKFIDNISIIGAKEIYLTSESQIPKETQMNNNGISE